jgi:two-component system LytT family sensor kinase
MTLTILALFIFIFGAYSYGYLVMLWFRDRGASAWTPGDASEELRRYGSRIGLAMFLTCTVWFVLHAIIAFGSLMGNKPEDDLVDLATLEIVFLFPGLIFHAYLFEATSDQRPFDRAGRWRLMSWGLYLAGLAMAVYATAAIFGVFSMPRAFGTFLNVSISVLFTAMSISCLFVMDTRPARPATSDQRSLQKALRALFFVMIVVFIAMNFLSGTDVLLGLLNILVRTTPLFFLLVSVYFESRIEFYDLVVKRGVLLMLSLLMMSGVLAVTMGWMDRMPASARPWLVAVLLLPVAMALPWLHDRVGRLLDRLWFGREFTPVEAIKHVLAAMQSATDETTLSAATEKALNEIFRRRVVVLRESDATPPDVSDVVDIHTTSQTGARFAILADRSARPFLSEDLALMRSLGGVYGYMLENARLQRKRQEQEQLAQDLRLQTSRSELKALRAQINPHFLFNALNAIASLIHTDPARADAAVEQLAEVFRYTLRRSEQEWAPLDQELAFARAYLDVEQARFGKRLEYSIQSDASLARAHVPSMLLQTLVENAVKHGISKLRGPGRIDIRTTTRHGRLVLEVRDTGPGLETVREPPRTSESFGLRSVRERLQAHFGASASLDLAREGEVTVARLELPLIEDLSPAAGAVRQ